MNDEATAIVEMRLSLALGMATFLLALAVFHLTNAEKIGTISLIAFYWPVVRSASYIGLAVGGCAYAIRCGGAPERIAGIVILATLTAHPVMHLVLPPSFVMVDPVHVLIDLVRFAAFMALSLRAFRYWPLCLSALQLLALGSHPAKAMDLEIHPVIYATMVVMWTYGILIVLIFATSYHQKLLARGVMRKSWSNYLHQ